MNNYKKIIIIEDEPILLQMLKDKFERNGVKVGYATDGEEGLALIIKDKPQLVLLDLMLPKMSGETILKEIKKNKLTKDIPVVVMSAKADDATVVNCLNNLGADDYIVKSNFTLEQVLDKINKYIS